MGVKIGAVSGRDEIVTLSDSKKEVLAAFRVGDFDSPLGWIWCTNCAGRFFRELRVPE